MNGCEMMKCTNYDNGRCAYPGETCKYRGHSSVQSTALLETDRALRRCIHAFESFLADMTSPPKERRQSDVVIQYLAIMGDVLSDAKEVISNAEAETSERSE